MKKSTDRYKEIRKEAESWPNWKKEVYNSLATSVHAKKIPLTPQTWSDAINAMSVEGKAGWAEWFVSNVHEQADKYAFLHSSTREEYSEKYKEYMSKFFASPYDGGKAQEGALDGND